MKWQKQGLLIAPEQVPWGASHVAVPFVDARGDGRFRVYFTSRDDRSRSHTGYAEFDIADPAGTVAVAPEPVLYPGTLGAFDDNGAMGSWLVDHDGRRYLYYIGWTLGGTVPFYSFTGLAISDDGGETFTRWSRGYLLERDDLDPYIATNPCVMIDTGLWRMWYISGVRWAIEDDKPKHYYHIKYAESDDGLHWRRTGKVAIDFKSSAEYAIARPAVRKEGDVYTMWYSYRASEHGPTYRIGYAESADGIEWERKDDLAGIDLSDEGWDADMVEYAFVFDHDGDRYMLYNGNGYGRTGVGLAKELT